MMTLLGGGVILFSLSPWLGLGFVFLFVAGFGYLSANTRATTQLQLEVAERNGDGSWRSGRSPSSACVRLRA